MSGSGPSHPMTLFDAASRAMSAQLVRMNAATSNLANAGTVAGSAAAAYRPLRPVFATVLDGTTGIASVKVQGVYQSGAAPVRTHDPDNPLADANGDVWGSGVDENAEMIEITDASRQYQNMVEAMQTAKQLTLDTMRMKTT
ncbi:flagellar basal body rod protein FlgC [Novosphingobium sp. FSW06-99]|uniref:flagellar basal body rod protein FlgC n=1 Tax=Novosphingobium sp. FSW06-99 TaxID=1739113 RepID=UPI00076C0B3A|nr:flagellar basal body rod protein FlgC [Novosphingobium sp. FSW06-99]KUR71925.1 flagellar basal-body rod protein FlgC [Novosphingobium sp. FSW06-99]